jgi:hypothetical protein
MSSQFYPYSLELWCDPYPVEIPWCAQSLLLPTNNADTNVIVVFVDKFGTQYKYPGTTDSDGVIEVPLNTFPAGLFNPYAGKFSVYIQYEGQPPEFRVWFRSDTGFYPSLVLSVYKTNYLPNTTVPVELSRFLCCCINEHRCGDYDLDPCHFNEPDPNPPLVCEITADDIVATWRDFTTGLPVVNDTITDSRAYIDLAINVPDCCGGNCSVVYNGFTVLSGSGAVAYGPGSILECTSTTFLRFVGVANDPELELSFTINTQSCNAYTFTKYIKIDL